MAFQSTLQWFFGACLIFSASIFASSANAIGGKEDGLARQCDELTMLPSNPDNPFKVTPVFWNEIDSAQAITVCGKAYETSPENERMAYQYGRALMKAGDFDAVWEILKRHRLSDYPPLLFLRGNMYDSARGVERNNATAILSYRRAAEGGLPAAYYYWGEILDPEETKWERTDPKRAMELYELGAKAGSPLAMEQLADYLYDGTHVTTNFKRAFYWYKQASGQRMEYSQYSLGYMHYYGEGTPENWVKGVKYLRMGAENGEEYAMDELADLLSDGRLRPSDDIPEARKWYIEALKRGEEESLERLLAIDLGPFSKNRGSKQALVWLDIAVEQNMSAAVRALADQLDKGDEGVPKDQERATRLYVKLANEEWDGPLFHKVGERFEKGIGIEPDLEQAKYWYEQAVEADSFFAKFSLARVKRKLKARSPLKQ